MISAADVPFELRQRPFGELPDDERVLAWGPFIVADPRASGEQLAETLTLDRFRDDLIGFFVDSHHEIKVIVPDLRVEGSTLIGTEQSTGRPIRFRPVRETDDRFTPDRGLHETVPMAARRRVQAF